MDGVIRQLGAITLQLAQAVEKALRDVPDFRALEMALLQATQEAARQVLVTALEAVDRQLMEQRDRR
ncbi:hypothetical protein DYI95_003045 [Thermaerobacter sp. PB12/4term]|uniref:hypothetical protein n=1 Tax=Thermaerobacter sp. PB12/4term TaxID=2293838 RepID=UPI000E32D0FE|nr:hypothetical protein [Thermaerobacter sp. PB12/4term]QIA26637.1 hypothetical protein DYI95_003045 [Thermaerobacter sp. PB12/4term]